MVRSGLAMSTVQLASVVCGGERQGPTNNGPQPLSTADVRHSAVTAPHSAVRLDDHVHDSRSSDTTQSSRCLDASPALSSSHDFRPISASMPPAAQGDLIRVQPEKWSETTAVAAKQDLVTAKPAYEVRLSQNGKQLMFIVDIK